MGLFSCPGTQARGLKTPLAFGACQFPFVPGYPPRCRLIEIGIVLHGRTPWLQRRTSLPWYARGWDFVRYWTNSVNSRSLAGNGYGATDDLRHWRWSAAVL